MGQAETFDRRAVDLVDDIARKNSCPRGGRIVDWRYHLEETVLHVDLHAEAAELAAGGRLHVAIALRIHVARMRIKRLENSVDRCVEKLFVFGLVDVVGTHDLQHLAEYFELSAGLGAGRRGSARPDLGIARVEAEREQRGGRCRTDDNFAKPQHGDFPFWR